MSGKKFRRWDSVGPYILDFDCPERRLAVELNGHAHFSPMTWECDCRRTEYLRSLSIRVARFENCEVFESLEWVPRTIGECLTVSDGAVEDIA